MENSFAIHSPFQPAGDQPKAIKELVSGLQAGLAHQTLVGVTGSGKTFTIAHTIQQMGRPTMVLAPNKTLAAQLYGEFKEFFPNNALGIDEEESGTGHAQELAHRFCVQYLIRADGRGLGLGK